MSATSTTDPFRVTLLRVADLLTKENVQRLAFLCRDISPARRENLNNGVELFAALQGRDLLGEEKVGTLVAWLDELSLHEASKLLREYSDKYLKVDPTVGQRCLIHEDFPMKYFCVSCDTKICPDCAYTSHSGGTGCDVISVDKLGDEIASRKAKLVGELENTRAVSEAAEKLWKQKREFLEKFRHDTRERAMRGYQSAVDIAALAKYNEDEVTDMMNSLSEQKELLGLRNYVDLLREGSLGPSEPSLQELKRISKATREMKGIRANMENQRKSLRKGSPGVVYRDGNGDGGFEIVTALVGNMSLRTQLVNITDDRHISGGVVLSCVDADAPTKELWRHTVTISDRRAPVVMSHVDMWYSGKNYILFAAGKTVYVVLPHSTGSLCDFIQSERAIEIDGVPGSSWITSVTAVNLSGLPCQLFLISTHGTNTIREYDLSGRSTRSISLDDHVPPNGVRCVAYYDSTFAVVSHMCGEVKLFRSPKGTVEECGTLKSPSAELKPVLVISSGANWLVLHAREGSEAQWAVTRHDEMGEVMKVCAKGASDGNANPVSISRWRGNGYVTFADRSVRLLLRNVNHLI